MGLLGNSGPEVGGSEGDALPEDGTEGNDPWEDIRLVCTGGSIMVTALVKVCDGGREEGCSMTIFPRLSRWGFTVEVGDRGETRAGVIALDPTC